MGWQCSLGVNDMDRGGRKKRKNGQNVFEVGAWLADLSIQKTVRPRCRRRQRMTGSCLRFWGCTVAAYQCFAVNTLAVNLVDDAP